MIEQHDAIEIATAFLEATNLLPPLYEVESFVQIDRVNGSDVATSVEAVFTPLIQIAADVVAPVRDGDIRLWIGESGEILRLQSLYRKVEPELIPVPMLPEEAILRGLTLPGLPLEGLSRTLSFVALAPNYEQHFMDPLFEVIDDSGALIATTPATGFTPRLGYIGPDPAKPIVAGQTVLLQATATKGTPPYRFSWFSSLDGPLGSGDSLPTQLSPGMNRIDLTVTDQNGAGVSGSILLNVVHNPELPTLERVFLPWVDTTTVRSFLGRQIPDNAAVESQPAPVRILPGGNIPDPIDATHIEIPSLTLGNIEFPGEVNRFAFETISGQTYVLETSLTTLADSVLTLFDTSGNQLERNDDYAYPELASRIVYTASRSETVVLEVTAYSETQSGSYALTIDLRFLESSLGKGSTTGEATLVSFPLSSERVSIESAVSSQIVALSNGLRVWNPNFMSFNVFSQETRPIILKNVQWNAITRARNIYFDHFFYSIDISINGKQYSLTSQKCFARITANTQACFSPQSPSITTTDCQIWCLILRIRPRASHRGTLLAVRFKPKLVAKITLSDKPSL